MLLPGMTPLRRRGTAGCLSSGVPRSPRSLIRLPGWLLLRRRLWSTTGRTEARLSRCRMLTGCLTLGHVSAVLLRVLVLRRGLGA